MDEIEEQLVQAIAKEAEGQCWWPPTNPDLREILEPKFRIPEPMRSAFAYREAPRASMQWVIQTLTSVLQSYRDAKREFLRLWVQRETGAG